MTGCLLATAIVRTIERGGERWRKGENIKGRREWAHMGKGKEKWEEKEKSNEAINYNVNE